MVQIILEPGQIVNPIANLSNHHHPSARPRSALRGTLKGTCNFMADYTNLLKVKEKEKSPDSAKALTARLNVRTHEMVVGQWLMDIREIGAVGAVDIRPRLL
jgi:hypothetical protein